MLKALSENADGKVRIHAAIDTGMTRIGLHGETDKIYGELKEISSLKQLRWRAFSPTMRWLTA